MDRAKGRGHRRPTARDSATSKNPESLTCPLSPPPPSASPSLLLLAVIAVEIPLPSFPSPLSGFHPIFSICLYAKEPSFGKELELATAVGGGFGMMRCLRDAAWKLCERERVVKTNLEGRQVC